MDQAHPGRPRLFDSQTGVELHRHSDMWFEDGSVICRAENVLFRVHMSQLSRHSVCFRDMFALASTSASKNDADEIEGCPVIVLHDAAEDVGNLLTALYDGP